MAAPKEPSCIMAPRQSIAIATGMVVIICSVSLFRLVSVSTDCSSSSSSVVHTASLEQQQQRLFNGPPQLAVAVVPNTVSGDEDDASLFSLASAQSNGFFDDISNASWKRLQDRARNLKKYKHSKDPDQGHQLASAWYLDNLQPDFTCPHKHRVKRNGIGPNYTCDPHRLANKKDCLIYSFGNDGDYRWEDSLIDIVGSSSNTNTRHCEIHIFGPDNHLRVGDAVSKNMHYHQWALSSSYDLTYNKFLEKQQEGVAATTIKAHSFPEILQMLGHENRTIDVLRLDCDKCEWTTYEDWISADVRQILVETHGLPNPDKGNAWRGGTPLAASTFFNAFTTENFAMFSKETNVFNGAAAGVDFGYVKLHSDFWGSNGKEPLAPKPKYIETDFLNNVWTPGPTAPGIIPERVVWIHPTNLLETQDDVEYFFNSGDMLSILRDAFGPQLDTWIVDDLTCLAVIHKVKPELLSHYREEDDELRRNYMCRAAALYVAGGYYFDLGFVLEAFSKPAEGVVLVMARDGEDISNEFIASEQNSIVMKLALDNMHEYYKTGQMKESDPLVEAIRELQSTIKTEVVPLESIQGKRKPWITTVPPLNDPTKNPVPVNMREPPSSHYRIPRRMIFTSNDNLLETKQPALLYENVQRTIRMYREAWNDPSAPVWFLDDDQCRLAILSVKPNLVTFFDRETRGAWKADMCRIAALYLTGGYYFDVDQEVITPYMPERDVNFATAETMDKKRFVQSFIASKLEGVVLKKALSEMLLFYETKRDRSKMSLGPETLKWAHDLVPMSVRGHTVILEQPQFPLDENLSEVRRNGVGCCCAYGIQDPGTKERLFFSRVVGSGPTCMPSAASGSLVSATT